MLRAWSILLLVSVAAGAQQPSTITYFREGSDTIARAISNSGTIVGSYTPTNNNTQTAGFIRNPNGSIQTILFPNATNTQLNGINDLGEVVGNFASNTRGFIRNRDGTYTEITVPDTTLVRANSINNNGYIVGAFQRTNTSRRPFLRDLATVAHPLAEIIAGDVDALVINSNNRILLSQPPGAGYSHYASDSQGAFLPIYLWTIGVDNGGQIRALNAGNIFAGDNFGLAFLYRSAFDGVTFRLPGTTGTYLYGINDRNQIVGAARDFQGVNTGFLLNPCSPTLTSTAGSHGAQGETGVIPVQVPSNNFCLWVADNAHSWITLTKSIGTHSSNIVYTLQPNLSTAPRSGTITVGNSEFTVTQASSDCRYTVTPNAGFNLPVAGGYTNFTIVTSAGCPWTAYSSSPWFRFSATSGTGEAVIRGVFDPVAGSNSRFVQVNVAGVAMELRQLVDTCTYRLYPESFSLGAPGGTRTVLLTTRSDCVWTAVTGSPWITVGSNSSSTGSADLTVNIAPNPSEAPRTGSVFIHRSAGSPGAVLSVQQAGNVCTYSLPAVSRSVGWNLTSNEYFTVAAPDGCAVTPTTGASWIRIHTTTQDPRTVWYTVERNPTRETRHGTIQVAGLSYTIEQTGNPYARLAFFPLTPCRIMDTRPGSGFTGLQGTPAIAPSSPQSLPITGRCGVPTTARAVAVNVTTIPIETLAGFLVTAAFSVGPFDGTQAGRNSGVVAGVYIIPGPSATFHVTDPTHMIVDVTGYFAEPSIGVPNPLAFYPMQPCRLLDTRTAGNTPIPAGSPREVQTRGQCGIPANAAALAVNLTAIPRGPLDYLTIYPSGQPIPLASTINAFDGRVVANTALVGTGTGGALSLFASRETDAIIDVTGYFAQPSDSGLYLTLTPNCAFARLSGLLPGTLRTVMASEHSCRIPAEARAHLLHAAAMPSASSLAFLSVFTAPTWPMVSTLNAYHGRTTANTTIVADNGQGIGVLISDPAYIVLDNYGYFAP